MSAPSSTSLDGEKSKIKKYLRKHEYLFHVTLILIGGWLGYGSSLELFESKVLQATWRVLLGGTGGTLVGVTVLFWLKTKFLVSGTDAQIADDLEVLREHVTKKLPEISDLQDQVLGKLDLLRTKDELGRFYTDEKEYYNRFYYLVSHARTSVNIVGDGFSCHDEPNRKKAENLIKSMRTALEQKTLVRRFQYYKTLSIVWLNMLIILKEDFGDQFRVYMNRDLDPQTLPYVIVITDAGEKEGSVNIMFTMNADTSMEQKTAGPAFIFESCQKFSLQVRRATNDYYENAENLSVGDLRRLSNKIQDERRKILSKEFEDTSPISIENTAVLKLGRKLKVHDVDLIRKEVVNNLSERKRLYFAYGSNLSRDRLLKRSGTAELIAVAELPEYKLVFNMLGNAGEGKDGGIANVVQNSEEFVMGKIYTMESKDFELLCNIEEGMGYNIKRSYVNTDEFGSVQVQFFIGNNGTSESFKPNVEYAKFITEGLEETVIPAEYREKVYKLINDC